MSTDDKKSHDLLPENRASCTEKNVWITETQNNKKKKEHHLHVNLSRIAQIINQSEV